MYACTGAVSDIDGGDRDGQRAGHRGGRAGRPAVGEVAGSALSPGRSELFLLSSLPTQLRRTRPMLLASQIDPRYVGSNHGQPFGFLIVVRLIILLVFSRFFDILLSAFRTRQPGRPTLGFWSSFLSQHTSALGV